jgi:hypothetical protein
LRYFFGFAIAVKLNTCNHSQNPYTNTTFSFPTFGKNHYPLAVIFICTYLRYFSTLRRGAMSSPTISRKQDHLAGARINEVVLVTCTCGKLLSQRTSLTAVFPLLPLVKKWRWLAVSGGNRVFQHGCPAFLRYFILLKPFAGKAFIH